MLGEAFPGKFSSFAEHDTGPGWSTACDTWTCGKPSWGYKEASLRTRAYSLRSLLPEDKKKKESD